MSSAALTRRLETFTLNVEEFERILRDAWHKKRTRREEDLIEDMSVRWRRAGLHMHLTEAQYLQLCHIATRE